MLYECIKINLDISSYQQLLNRVKFDIKQTLLDIVSADKVVFDMKLKCTESSKESSEEAEETLCRAVSLVDAKREKLVLLKNDESRMTEEMETNLEKLNKKFLEARLREHDIESDYDSCGEPYTPSVSNGKPFCSHEDNPETKPTKVKRKAVSRFFSKFNFEKKNLSKKPKEFLVN
jgi:hypothetical protein